MVKAAAEFVPVRVDSDLRPELVRLWQVRDMPEILCFSPAGGLLARRVGPLIVAQDLLEILGAATRECARTRGLEEAARAAPLESARGKALADAYFKQRAWERAAAEYERVLTLAPAGAPGDRETAAALVVYAELMRAGRAEAATAAAERFAREYPASRRLPEVLYWEGLILLRDGKAAEARAVLGRVIRDFPDDPSARPAAEALRRAEK